MRVVDVDFLFKFCDKIRRRRSPHQFRLRQKHRYLDLRMFFSNVLNLRCTDFVTSALKTSKLDSLWRGLCWLKKNHSVAFLALCSCSTLSRGHLSRSFEASSNSGRIHSSDFSFCLLSVGSLPCSDSESGSFQELVIQSFQVLEPILRSLSLQR